jgi:hypothetical protein
MGVVMHSTLPRSEWKGQETTGKHWQGAFPFLAQVRQPAPVDMEFIRQATEPICLRYAVQRSGKDDHEVAHDIAISPGYMSKVLKGTAGLHGARLVAFMRSTGSIAPLQWLAEQVGCEVTVRDSRAAEVAALRQRLHDLEQAA